MKNLAIEIAPPSFVLSLVLTALAWMQIGYTSHIKEKALKHEIAQNIANNWGDCGTAKQWDADIKCLPGQER